MNPIKIQGARVHNLKNLNLTIPKNKFIVATGISGSGKSSLVFDILFEEGRKQYLQSLGILSDLSNEDKFDNISGLGPTIAVRQNIIRQSNPRSTVGTKTGLLNLLALLYAGEGTDSFGEHLSPKYFSCNTSEGMCMKCGGLGSYYALNLEQLIPDRQMPLCQLFASYSITSGFIRLLKKRFDTYWNTPFEQLSEDVQNEVIYGNYNNNKQSYSLERMCKSRLEKGEDVSALYSQVSCSCCHGFRISEQAQEVTLAGRHMGELGLMELSELSRFLHSLSKKQALSSMSLNLLKDIQLKLSHLSAFRLDHLTLYRALSTLSGGELQRLFLNSHLESRLDSLIYVFDEPTAGLHPSEKEDTLHSIRALQELGNTVIAVEHDPGAIRQADHIIDIGPYAGVNGGQIMYEGDYTGLLRSEHSITGQYLSGKRSMPKRTLLYPPLYTACPAPALKLNHACANNLKDISVSFPLHALVGIAGKSGSGKSTLISDTLLPLLRSACRQTLKASSVSSASPAEAASLVGAEKLNGFAEISQQPIGRNSSSTPASFIGIWDKIRELFAHQADGQLSPGHFSFNSLGACPTCKGTGYEKIMLGSNLSMDKICPACNGKRFNEETLSILFQGRTISEVLNMSIETACHFFADYPSVLAPLQILTEMGMGYLRLGQPTSTLSGGESQRIKLARELGKRRTGAILYVLDEPTTGLSQYDTARLIQLLDKLVANGNSVIIIEHNPDMLRSCDWIIELGPEGGKKGGYLIAEGTPEELRHNTVSLTGPYL